MDPVESPKDDGTPPSRRTKGDNDDDINWFFEESLEEIEEMESELGIGEKDIINEGATIFKEFSYDIIGDGLSHGKQEAMELALKVVHVVGENQLDPSKTFVVRVPNATSDVVHGLLISLHPSRQKLELSTISKSGRCVVVDGNLENYGETLVVKEIVTSNFLEHFKEREKNQEMYACCCFCLVSFLILPLVIMRNCGQSYNNTK
jgi:hypothetical protein